MLKVIVLIIVALSLLSLATCKLEKSATSSKKSKSRNASNSANSKKTVDDIEFSGFYSPNREHSLEIYAGAWLAGRMRILDRIENIRRITHLEHASTSIIIADNTVMSRDFFDYQVLHLSSTSNQIPYGVGNKLLNSLMKRLKFQMWAFSNHTNSPEYKRSDDKRLNEQTLVAIPFSLKAASTMYAGYKNISIKDFESFQTVSRNLYFQITFWSIYRFFPKIMVAISSDYELETLKSFGLPIWKIFDARKKTAISKMLPKILLMEVYEMLNNSTDFRYVYYSEGDHVLYMREPSKFFDLIDKHGGNIATTPHRMQTIALPKSYPRFLSTWSEQTRDALKDIHLITESYVDPKGSCCDNGRFVFQNCGNWWYNCQNWGLRNYTDWIRFGRGGFTMPLGTEHQARCKFSKERQTCPLPDDCKNPLFSPGTDPCGEIPNVEYTFPGQQKK